LDWSLSVLGWGDDGRCRGDVSDRRSDPRPTLQLL